MFEILRSDATHLATASTIEQAAELRDTTVAALTGREAMWEGSDEDLERIAREKKQAIERYRERWGRNPPA